VGVSKLNKNTDHRGDSELKSINIRGVPRARARGSRGDQI
jgi:hypothetical protein